MFLQLDSYYVSPLWLDRVNLAGEDMYAAVLASAQNPKNPKIDINNFFF